MSGVAFASALQTRVGLPEDLAQERQVALGGELDG